MADIAGCRVTLEDVDTLYRLLDRLDSSRSVHEIIKVYDYMKPKMSGYGGVHLIYECFKGDKSSNSSWQGCKG